jgi:hypothetical protein
MNPATDWIDQARGLLDLLKQGMAAPADGAHAGDCRWCPVCQAAAVLRGERPEVTAAIADVLTATATALREFADADRPPAGEPTPEPAPTDGRADEPGHPPAMQRIEIA